MSCCYNTLSASLAVSYAHSTMHIHKNFLRMLKSNHIGKLASTYSIAKEYRGVLPMLDDIVHEKLRAPLSQRFCPECQRQMYKLEFDIYDFSFCKYCQSTWFDTGKLMQMTNLSKDIPSDYLMSRRSEFTCPLCKLKMIEYNYCVPTNILVSRCVHNHGIYLHNGVLRSVLEFISG